jgi:predicted nuclease of restriction endonuclease-like (RecB) superfamily
VEKDNPKLKGVLDKSYARWREDEALPGLIDEFSKIPFNHGALRAKDILGHIYEYFLGEFSIAAGKRGGEFYTPKSIVSLIVEMLEPFEGRVYDPCCGSGGFFVQSERFVLEHGGKIGQLSIYGQEFNPSNSVMVLLYWDIGRRILQKQAEQGYGTKVIDRLAADLRQAFPDMKGFSPRNLKYMRAFATAWPDRELVQRTVAQLSWGQNIVLLEKLTEGDDRLWYAARTLEHGWSRDILGLQIRGQAHLRHGKAQNNFPATLPPPASDMAVQVFKDPYLFDFLGTDAPRREQQLEQGLIDHIQKFLLELGQGFAFVGRQVHLEIGDDDFYLDLLFYHLKLRCYLSRAVESAQVIEELIAMAKEFREAALCGDKLGLNTSELAFYDALTDNESAVRELSDDVLKKIAVEITEKLRNSTTVDWQKRESVRARLRNLVRITLRRYKYPPDMQEEAIRLVLEQAERLSDGWTK